MVVKIHLRRELLRNTGKILVFSSFIAVCCIFLARGTFLAAPFFTASLTVCFLLIPLKFIMSRATVFDISDKKEAAESLKRVRLEQMAILNNIPDMAWLKDKDSVFIAVNETFARACGRPIEEVAGKTDLDLWPKELAESYRADDREVIGTGKRKVVEEEFENSSGQRIWIETIKTPICNDSGEIIGTTGIARDITKRKEAEQATRLGLLGRMVADMAHEVNNPLMIISGNAQLALLEDGLSADLKDTLGVIVQQSQRAKEIITRLLRFSRPSQGEFKPASINHSLENVIGLVEHQFSLSNIRIDRTYSPGLPPVRMDEQQMHEVFLNLLNNARDAMPDGGAITIRTGLGAGGLRVEFRDTGCGMSEKVRQRVMEPFFSTKEKGTGLGLAVCYGIVKAHGGELRLASEEGKGTTVSILLPLKEFQENAGDGI